MGFELDIAAIFRCRACGSGNENSEDYECACSAPSVLVSVSGSSCIGGPGISVGVGRHCVSFPSRSSGSSSSTAVSCVKTDFRMLSTSNDQPQPTHLRVCSRLKVGVPDAFKGFLHRGHCPTVLYHTVWMAVGSVMMGFWSPVRVVLPAGRAYGAHDSLGRLRRWVCSLPSFGDRQLWRAVCTGLSFGACVLRVRRAFCALCATFGR